MDAFWHFAGRMLRYRATIVWAMVFALLSAGGLGVGLVSIAPLLKIILADSTAAPAPAASPAQPDQADQVGANTDPPRQGAEPGAEPARSSESPKPSRGLRDVAEAYNNQIPDFFSWARLPQHRIDRLPTGPFTAVVVIVSALGVLTLVGGIANFLHAYLSLTVVYRTLTNIRREAFHRVVRLPLKTVVSGGSNDLVSRIVNDTNQLSQGFATLLSRTVAQASKGLVGLLAAVIIEPILVLAALPVTALLYIVIRRLGKRIRRASRGALRSQAGLFGATTEVLQGLRVVKVYTTERYEAGRFHRINKQFMHEMMRVRVARALASPLVEILSIFALGVLSLVAAKAILDKKLDVEDFIAALLALGAAGASLKPLTGLINEIQASSAAAQRLAELLAEPLESGHSLRLPKLGRHAQSIEFDRISFTYPNSVRPALREVSLRVAHGERVAIVGPNGCGKTTLLALVPRLFDPDPGEDGAPGGRVMIDGCDIRDYSVRSLRRQIGVVTQETVIFHGTIASNIAYGAEGATPDRVRDAARKARAHDFIERLPAAYDSVVGEQGLTLSGGQRQRIAIARAILRDPAILILDEATSMIDGESEARIGEAIADFSQGRTCLLVAHRLSTVLSADRIVVMHEGRVIDQGTHQDLLTRCDVYRQLFERRA